MIVPMDTVVLAIDCGTQSIRSILFNTCGELLHIERMGYEPYVSPLPGRAEQNAELYWDGLCRTCRSLAAKHPELMAKVAGVGVTTQRNTMINVDAKGRPLRPAIVWPDQRKARVRYVPGFPMNWAYRVVGMSEAVRKVQADGACNWIIQNEPDIWARTSKYLQVSGFLNHRLTGAFRDSLASQIGHIPVNYKRLRWARRWELTRKLFPVEREKLPELVRPGDLIGHVTHQAADETGIPAGVPVIACGSDKGCETLGSGVRDTTMASLSFGTTATVQTITRRYCEPLRFMPAYPSPIPECFNPEVEIFRGYWMITWFKKELAHKEVTEAESLNIAPEILLNGLLSEAPPGSMGLVVQPFWGPGLKQPAAKGAIIGFGDVHTRAHLYRALIEGIGYALLDGLHKIERACRTRVTKLAVSGGAAQSDEICRISADIFNLPLVRGKTWETAGLGAAIVTAVGVGLHDSFETAIERMVSPEHTFLPDPENARIYQQLYTRVYQGIYPSLEKLYKEIRDITGYPENPE
jgi:sugar (pentulose or hexulose) kinase